jgi:hypothetical protein
MSLTRRERAELRDLEAEFVICRARRHRMRDIPFIGHPGAKWQPSKSVEILAQRCERCSVVREEIWNVYTGAIIAVQYRYPRGYHLSRDIKPKDVRKEFLTRGLYKH